MANKQTNAMKNFILSTALAFAGATASAQMPYNLSVQSQPYAHLTTAPANDTTAWDKGNFSAALPFTFNLAGQPITRFNLMMGNIGPASDTAGTVNGMVIIGATLADRGLLTGRSRSPIRFQVVGTAPNRVFKAELQGAGFMEEMIGAGTTADSVNLQVWLYETSNVIELRYGPSRVSANPDYFINAGPSVGFVRGFNFDVPIYQKFYGLVGSPTAPVIDSFTFGGAEGGLNSYPPAGTVYRFTPKSATAAVAQHQSEIALVRPYPNPFTDELIFRYGGRGNVDYQIFTLTGARLMQGQVGHGEHRLDVNHLVPGAYIVRISSGTEARSAQFIKR